MLRVQAFCIAAASGALLLISQVAGQQVTGQPVTRQQVQQPAGTAAQLQRPAPITTPAISRFAPQPAVLAQRPLSSPTRNVLNFYGASHAATTLGQIPRPAGSRLRTSAPVRLPRQIRSPRSTFGAASRQSTHKPFGSMARERPTVSPYLNLFRQEDPEAAPNYFAFVRPQLQQIETSQRQQAEIRRLRRQLQRTESVVNGSQSENRSMSTTGHGTRFMDLGGFYAR